MFKKLKKAIKRWRYPVQVGDVWGTLEEDPFKDCKQFTIIDYKEGWVKCLSSEGDAFTLKVYGVQLWAKLISEAE